MSLVLYPTSMLHHKVGVVSENLSIDRLPHTVGTSENTIAYSRIGYLTNFYFLSTCPEATSILLFIGYNIRDFIAVLSLYIREFIAVLCLH